MVQSESESNAAQSTSAGYRGRPPALVMSERRLGALFPTAISHSRSAMRQIEKMPWRFERTRFDLDAHGYGVAVYRATTGDWTFHAVMVGEHVPDNMRTDRSIGLYWDVSCALCDGPWDAEREAHIAAQAPKQKYGHGDPDTLAITRGNRSARLFDHVVETLAAGNQPDVRTIGHVGYLLRTTAFFGNGRVGTRPLVRFPADHPLKSPFHAQIFTGFLLREFVSDQAEHIAAARSSSAVPLHTDLRRYIGIGNSAGIGLVPFAVNHPHVLNAWLTAYEGAAAAALDQPTTPESQIAQDMSALLDRAVQYFEGSLAEGLGHFTEHSVIAKELSGAARLVAEFRTGGLISGRATERPWRTIAERLNSADPETEEVFRGICIEANPDVVARFDLTEPIPEDLDVRPWETVASLRDKTERGYAWALSIDMSEPQSDAVFWYRSEEAYEPRLGVRGEEPGAEHESAMFIVRDVHRLYAALAAMPEDAIVADLLHMHPDLTWITQRVQNLSDLPYAEMHVNFLDSRTVPLFTIRPVLAFYGLDRFDPRSTRWVRATFLQGAPTAADLMAGRPGTWPFPLPPDIAHVAANADVRVDIDHAPKDMVVVRKEMDDTDVGVPERCIELFDQIAAAAVAVGVPRGYAQRMAHMVLFREILFGDGLAELERRIATGWSDALPLPLAFKKDDDGIWQTKATSACSLALGPMALDLAMAEAASGKPGIAVFPEVGDSLLLAQLAQHAARLGFQTVASGGGLGTVVGIPESNGAAILHLPERVVALATLKNAGDSWDRMPLSEIFDALARADADCETPAILCVSVENCRYSAADIDKAVSQLRPTHNAILWTASDIDACSAEAERDRLLVRRATIEALIALDAKSLVPASEASRIGAGA